MRRTLRDCLLDEAFEAYVAWRLASALVEDAYGRWSAGAPREDRAIAFAAYLGALEREQCAADAYGRRIERAGRSGSAPWAAWRA